MHDYFDVYTHVTHSMIKLPVSSFEQEKQRFWTGSWPKPCADNIQENACH